MSAGLVVKSSEALDALPDLAVVIDRDQDVSQKRGGQWCSYETAPMTSARLARYGPLTVIWTPAVVS